MTTIPAVSDQVISDYKKLLNNIKLNKDQREITDDAVKVLSKAVYEKHWEDPTFNQEHSLTVCFQAINGFLVTDANTPAPEAYVPFSWIYVTFCHTRNTIGHSDHRKHEKTLCLYPDIEMYQQFRRERLLEIPDKPYHFVTEKEPIALLKDGWEYGPLAKLRNPVRKRSGSNKMEPIRNQDTIETIYSYLSQQSEQDYLLFVLPACYGTSLTSLIEMTKRELLEYLSIHKQKVLQDMIPPHITEDKVARLLKYLQDEDPVFSTRRRGRTEPISRITAYNRLSSIAASLELNEKITQKSLEKTYQYHVALERGERP